MSFLERMNLAQIPAGLAVMIWYGLQIIPQFDTRAVEDIAFGRSMIVAVVAGIVLSVVLSITISVLTAIWVGRTEGYDRVDDTMSQEDERDRQVSRLGEARGGQLLALFTVIALGAILLEHDRFWVAHILFVGLWLSSLYEAIVKQIAWRRGV